MAEAKTAMNTYLSKANPDDVLPGDYLELANINSKMPGNEQEAFTNFQTAIDKDTSLENKIKYSNMASEMAKKMGDRKQQAYWAGVAYHLNKNPNQADLYNWGYSNYQAGIYDTAITIFCNMYESKYPNEIFGYLWCARANEAKDTSWQAGIAVGPYEKLAQMSLSLDSAKYKGQAKTALFKLASYANDVKKDPKGALEYINQILAFDPADPNALQIADILKKALSRPQKAATNTTTTKPPAKKPAPKSGGGGAASKKKT
jgi:tetratricopeptide (TPR) repeat protein